MFVSVRITGRVQGVWYRAWAQEEARGLGLKGWVKNCQDGAVEAVFEGDETSVRTMIERCHEGSPGAVVDTVTVTENAVSCGATGLEIVY